MSDEPRAAVVVPRTLLAAFVVFSVAIAVAVIVGLLSLKQQNSDQAAELNKTRHEIAAARAENAALSTRQSQLIEALNQAGIPIPAPINVTVNPPATSQSPATTSTTSTTRPPAPTSTTSTTRPPCRLVTVPPCINP